MAASILRMPGFKAVPETAPRGVRSQMETMVITTAGMERWKIPPFQRNLRVTEKVETLAKQIKADGGVIPGIITLGKHSGETYLVDGQHRGEAFRLSGCPEGIADVRICYFDSMADMATEFVTLNSALVRMRNDDILRGLEGLNPNLAALRRECPFIGYSNVRMKVKAPSAKLVLMAPVIRAWFGSVNHPNPGPATSIAAGMLDADEVKKVSKILSVCFAAWGTDVENYRLWGALNLSMVFWLWRRLVLKEAVPGHKQRGGVSTTKLTADQFQSCLMALSADPTYIEWLIGRHLKERDRSPAYNRIKAIFARRIMMLTGTKAMLPNPTWAAT